MSILKEDIHKLSHAFHHTAMIEKGDEQALAHHFMYPEPILILLHGDNLTMQQLYQLHLGLVDEKCENLDDMLLTPLCDEPDKARAVWTIYWEGRPKENAGTDEGLIKCFVGEDWIVQRDKDGELKIVQYINTFHHYLDTSSSLDL